MSRFAAVVSSMIMALRHVVAVAVGLIALAACSGSVGGGGESNEDNDELESDTTVGSDDDPALGTPDIRVLLGDVELAPGTARVLELGTTREGGFTPHFELVIENPGSAPVMLAAADDAPFTAAFPESLAPGASETLTVAMVASTAGAHSGTITLTTSVPAKASYIFELTGTVIAAPTGPLNPYWAAAPWKLWFEDPTPVEFSGIGSDLEVHTQTFASPSADTRKFPSPTALAAVWPAKFVELETAPATPGSAGWWDDAAGCMDNGHTSPWTGFAGILGNHVSLSGQFIRVAFGSPSRSQRHGLGLNFTSESLSGRGHQLTRFDANAIATERDWLFSNTMRGSPSYYSYNEYDAVYTSDNYDGLYGIGYQSLGRSNSETQGLFKMLFAGGYMPRTTKEQLKRHGLYAPMMLTLFRQALPYVNADGTPVDYEGEMIQRPTYLSNGEGTTTEFAPNNIVYHQYPDTLHLYRMVQAAKALDTPPPVAAMKLMGVASVTAGGESTPWALNDARIKVRSKTTTTIWADPGDTLDIRVDMGESLDLAGGELTFSAKVVYPNHEHVLAVEREGETAIFRIRATPDPTLPLGRAPVILQAHVRGLRSNPTFLNVFWRQPDQVDAYGQYFDATRNTGGMTNDRRKAVFWNARPTLTTSLGAATTMAGAVGVPATFTVACADPEGFPIRYYLRADTRGTLNGDTYSFTPTASGNFGAAIICSDGTGAFASTKITIEVP